MNRFLLVVSSSLMMLLLVVFGGVLSESSPATHSSSFSATSSVWERTAHALVAPYVPAVVDKPTSNSKRRKLQPPTAYQRQLEFGDYAAYPDSCPLVTSCPVICVANATDCPTVCPEGTELCGDTGICLEDCAEAEERVIENPCYCEELPFACAKPVDELDKCFDAYEDYYEVNQECIDAQEDAIPLVDFNGPWFKASYSILIIVSGLVFLYCAFNTYLSVPNSSTIMTTDHGEAWTLTGYRRHPVGMFIYFLVIMTLLGIQFALFVLTIFYYMQQEAITRWDPVFQDEVQVLKAFQIVWMVGIVWSFAFRYPSSIRDLFLRKCALANASFVAVQAPTRRVEASGDENSGRRGCGELTLMAFWKPFDLVLRFVFSYPYNKAGYETLYCELETDTVTGKRGFYCRMRRFVYNNDNQGDGSLSFQPGTIKVGTTLGDFLQQAGGLTTEQANQRFGLTGPNIIPMKKPSVFGSIIHEFSQPFYLYQNFMVWTWAPYWYYYMAIVNTVVRVTGGIVVGVFQYMGDSVLYQLSHVEGHSVVIRDGQEVEVANADIVPGDVVVLKPGVISCDMAVLKAEKLLVDEAALTGEAHPVVKSEIDPAMAATSYDPFRHKSFMLSAGTEILEVGDEAKQDLGLVMATSSFTSKGKLVTDVMAYQRHKFKFDDEVKLVLFILIIEAIFLVGMVFYFIDEDQWVYAWFFASFVLGTVIPPLLPTVFVVSVGISAKRLQAKRITCTYQEGILVAGKVNAAFFDKTGTLTLGMEFHSLDAESSELKEKATIGMAVCHTLHKTSEGQLIGNNVETVSFGFTGAEIADCDGASSTITLGDKTYTVVKQYEFDSHRVTQSVIVKDSLGKHSIFVKGSPEAIRALCVEGVPSTFDESLQKSSKSGMYQLAIASKDYNPDTDTSITEISRDEVERNLHFDAFLGFQNAMRENTPGVIKELLEGDISVTMITGDNVFTGICIAKAAGMIQQGRRVFLGTKRSDGEISWIDVDSDKPQAQPTEQMLSSPEKFVDLAVTGQAWTALLEDNPKYAASIAKHIRVFGRCNPSDKVSVVTHFVEQGHKTCMVGDGANDSGSLKSAHVGIALSTAEASVVAPFTSLDKDIASVSEVLREGRCALASAFAAYSYYIIYGQVESYLQVITAYLAITFTEWCWVFLDGIWSILMAFSLPLAKAATKLSPNRPTASLIGPRTMASVCGILAWNFVFLVIALAVLWNEDWFECRMWNTDDVSDVRSIGDNYETSVLFLVGGYQYIASAIALNFGYTWRENFWKNHVFVLLASLFTIMQFVATIYPSKFSCIWRVNCNNEDAVRSVTTTYATAIGNPWNTTMMPVEFRWKLVGIMAGNLIVLCLWQYAFVNGFLAAKLSKKKPSVLVAVSSSSTAEPIEDTTDLKQDIEEVVLVEKDGLA